MTKSDSKPPSVLNPTKLYIIFFLSQTDQTVNCLSNTFRNNINKRGMKISIFYIREMSPVSPVPPVCGIFMSQADTPCNVQV